MYFPLGVGSSIFYILFLLEEFFSWKMVNISIDMPNHRDGAGTAPARHTRARFFEFIQPLPEPNAINTAADDEPADGGGGLAFVDNDDHHIGPCRIGVIESWIKASGAVLNTALLLFTLTARPLKEISTEFQVAGAAIVLPLWKHVLGLLIIVFGRFIAVCIVGAVVFILSRSRLRLPHIVLYSNQSPSGTYIWAAVLYHFFAQLILPAASSTAAAAAAAAAFAMFAVCQGERILFRTFRTIVYVKQFDKKMKEASFHLFMLDALLGSTPDVLERVARCGCWWRSSRRRRRLEYGAGRLPQHVEDRVLLAKVDGCDESAFKFGRQLEILTEVNRAFPAIANGGGQYITREDMLRFLTEEERGITYPLMSKFFESGNIDRSAFFEWAIHAYRHRKSLVHAIADTRRMLLYLQYIAIALTTLAIAAAIHTEMTITVYVISILTLGHLSVNISKTVFDSILFVFVTHPFDVGDCCVIDGHQMIVEEMNILSTVFLRFDHNKVWYHNSQLSIQSICNCSRNPDLAKEIEFSVDVSTTEKDIDHLKRCIKEHLLSKPEHWQAGHSILMQGVEEKKIKMKLYVRHKTNYQNFPEMSKHMSELLIALKNIFQKLKISDYAIP